MLSKKLSMSASRIQLIIGAARTIHIGTAHQNHAADALWADSAALWPDSAKLWSDSAALWPD